MPLGSLWIPVVVSTVVVFMASGIAWMLLPHHRTDHRKLPDEDAVLAALRAQSAGPGLYSLPHCDVADRENPDFKAKVARGPVGMLTVTAGGWSFGRSLALWFGHVLLVSFFVAYAARHALGYGETFVDVMRVVATTAAIGYVLAQLPLSIWHCQPWRNTVKAMADGVVYSLLTGAVFGWLWPAA